MSLTLEEKVAKKAKGLDKLKYNKGIAIILLDVDEEAGEYNTNVDYNVRMYFKSKAAINRAGKLLGELRFNKKEMLNRFERGLNSIEVHLTSYDKFALDGGKNIQKEVRYSYSNCHSGGRFQIRLDPRKELSESQKDYHIGSTADGEPLEEYFAYLQKAIYEGKIQYIL